MSKKKIIRLISIKGITVIFIALLTTIITSVIIYNNNYSTVDVLIKYKMLIQPLNFEGIKLQNIGIYKLMKHRAIDQAIYKISKIDKLSHIIYLKDYESFEIKAQINANHFKKNRKNILNTFEKNIHDVIHIVNENMLTEISILKSDVTKKLDNDNEMLLVDIRDTAIVDGNYEIAIKAEELRGKFFGISNAEKDSKYGQSIKFSEKPLIKFTVYRLSTDEIFKKFFYKDLIFIILAITIVYISFFIMIYFEKKN